MDTAFAARPPAIRARRRIEWDSATMKVTNVAAANAFVTKSYRPGFGV